MNVRQLETFVRIVETGSFAAAAEALHITQSTASARVRELEKALGVPLFDRTQHRARLTPKGQGLLEPARQLVHLAGTISLQIGDLQALAGVVRLGVVGLVAQTWLAVLMTELRGRFPALLVHLEVGLTATLIGRLRAGELDLALVTGPGSEAHLESRSLGFESFAWMAAASLGVPAKAQSPAELARWPVLGLAAPSHHYPGIEQWFRAGHAAYRPAITCDNVRILGELSIAGLGVSLLPVTPYAGEIASGVLRVLKTTPALPPVECAVLYKSNTLNPAVSAVASLAVEVSSFRRARPRPPSGRRSRNL